MVIAIRPEERLDFGGRDEILEAARRLGAQFATRTERHDRDGTYAPENIDALRAAGLGNLNVPVVLRGLGADLGLHTPEEDAVLAAAGQAILAQ